MILRAAAPGQVPSAHGVAGFRKLASRGWSSVRALLQIATNAAEAQVIGIIRSAVLPPDGVVDLMGQNRRLRKAAVLTGAVGTPLDQLPRVARQLHEAARMVQNSSA